jgi:hypothetical protein
MAEVLTILLSTAQIFAGTVKPSGVDNSCWLSYADSQFVGFHTILAESSATIGKPGQLSAKNFHLR